MTQTTPSRRTPPALIDSAGHTKPHPEGLSEWSTAPGPAALPLSAFFPGNGYRNPGPASGPHPPRRSTAGAGTNIIRPHPPCQEVRPKNRRLYNISPARIAPAHYRSATYPDSPASGKPCRTAARRSVPPFPGRFPGPPSPVSSPGRTKRGKGSRANVPESRSGVPSAPRTRRNRPPPAPHASAPKSSGSQEERLNESR